MPLSLQISPQPANAPDVFSFTLIQQGTTRQYTLKKNLAENTVEQLRALVKKLGLCDTARLKKAELAAVLQPYVFFTTREEAEKAWPILTLPLEDTEAELREQSQRLWASAGWLDFNYVAHYRTKEAEIQAAIKTLQMEAERERQRERGELPPAWWEAGNFQRAEDSDDEEEAEPLARPYLRVIVQATERDHDGYCSGVDGDEEHGYHIFGGEVDVMEESYLMTGFLPLKTPQGENWNFQGPDFDPGWRCASGGSSVCPIRPTVRFISMTRVE